MKRPYLRDIAVLSIFGETKLLIDKADTSQ
jgi:hypothetical protein